MRIERRALACVMALALLVACTSGARGETDGVQVVASFYPLAEAAQKVGDGLVSVVNLTPSGVEPHDLELAPDDIETIATADVVLYLGGGFQPAVEDAVAQAENAVTVDVLEVVQTHPAPPGEADQGLEIDPHVWLDPARFEEIVNAVAEALSDADPPNQATYEANAAAYIQRLRELDREYRDRLANCERSTIVTSHEAFGYLAAAYGLHQVAISGLSPEAEPDARRLAELRDLVEQQGITTIFTEELVPPDVADTLARETGVRVDVLNPLESLTRDEVAAGEDYIGVMQANLAALRTALGCS